MAGPRSMWNGALSFGAVDVPIKVYAATEPQRGVRFRELHEPDGAEVRHELVDPDGRPVEREQVVKGFEVRPGEHVVLSDEEIKAAAAPQRKTVAIERFVRAAQIDPDVYDRPYYLAPQDEGREGYLLLAEALRQTGRVGVGRVVLRSREQLVAVLEREGVLRMHTLRFADELVSPGQLKDLPRGGRKPSERELKMATALVDSLAARFEPQRFEDRHRDRILELVARKQRGEQIDTAPPEAPEDSGDLLAALEASLAGAGRGS